MIVVANSQGNDVNDENDYTSNKLYQNTPNPFSKTTTIKYSVSDKANTAQILIFDMQGGLIKTYSNITNGKSELKIFAGELQPGMYLYTLVVDNKEIDTKRMILTN